MQKRVEPLMPIHILEERFEAAELVWQYFLECMNYYTSTANTRHAVATRKNLVIKDP